MPVVLLLELFNQFEGALDNALEMAQIYRYSIKNLDTDYAMELAELTEFQIMQQAVNNDGQGIQLHNLSWLCS